ncbi:MAG: type II secretion system protein GspD [Planctomycetes bacterium]|nr:type II secretion system protein GspD [Planctomycetota bacterium]
MKNLLLLSTVILMTLAAAAPCFGEQTRDKKDPFGQFEQTEDPAPARITAEYDNSPEPQDPIVTEVFNLNFANAKDTEKTIAALLSSNGRTGVDDRLNSLIVTDTKSNLELIRQILSKLDVKAPQVMIDVLIVNVKLTDEFKMGIDWAKLGRTRNFFSQTMNATASENPFGKITFLTTEGDWTFQGLIDFVETNQNVKIMANPKVLVLNNHTATINAVEEIPYKELSETSAGGSIGTVSFKEAGIKLEVTPQITDDGYIIMHIKPEQSARTGTFTVEGNDTPIIETRKTETTLRVRDGQTIIIGGLRRSEPSVVESKVPILGDIPLIGGLFRKIDHDEMVSELGIFITPHIYTDGKLSKEELELIEKTDGTIEHEEVAGNSLNSDPSWSTSGQWAFGAPAGRSDNKNGHPDPSAGHTGSNVYGVNLKGDYSTATGGPYYVTAGPFDLTGYYETQLEFASWLNSDNGGFVVHSLQISRDKGNWTTLWQQAGRDVVTASQWSDELYDISSVADNASTVYVRWGYEIIADRAKPYSGWNIDDVKLNGRPK